jgi:hypothetical protein
MNYSSATGLGVVAASLALPAGSYTFSAKVLVGNRVGTNEDVLCTLRHGQTGNIGIDDSGTRLGEADTAEAYTTLPLTGGATLDGAETVNLVCSTTSSDAFVNFGHITATQATLTNQP